MLTRDWLPLRPWPVLAKVNLLSEVRMRNNEDGEFEVVLGNKQLLSVFFIVVVLLGVFFTMGYVVGRKSSGDAAAQLVAERGSTADPASVSAAVNPPAESRTLAEPSGREEPPDPGADTGDRPSPMPSASSETTAPPVSAERFRPPQPGETYLQAAATKRSEAELMAEVLAKKGFQTTIMPAPNTEWYRVLVGPLPDAVTLDKTRTQLKEIGIEAILRKL